MSFIINLVAPACPHCGAVFERSWDPTYNLGPMFRRAGLDMPKMSGKLGREIGPIFRAAVDDMVANPAVYQALNSPNGWGVYDEDLLSMLREIRDAAESHPEAVFSAT